MKIILYKNYSDSNEANKELVVIKETTGTIKEDCSILDPVIVMKNFTELPTANYLYID